MTMHQVLHSRDDTYRLYVSKKEGGREFVSIKDIIDALIRWVENYMKRGKKVHYND